MVPVGTPSSLWFFDKTRALERITAQGVPEGPYTSTEFCTKVPDPPVDSNIPVEMFHSVGPTSSGSGYRRCFDCIFE